MEVLKKIDPEIKKRLEIQAPIPISQQSPPTPVGFSRCLDMSSGFFYVFCNLFRTSLRPAPAFRSLSWHAAAYCRE
jgi:hypothetical protein